MLAIKTAYDNREQSVSCCNTCSCSSGDRFRDLAGDGCSSWVSALLSTSHTSQHTLEELIMRLHPDMNPASRSARVRVALPIHNLSGSHERSIRPCRVSHAQGTSIMRLCASQDGQSSSSASMLSLASWSSWPLMLSCAPRPSWSSSSAPWPGSRTGSDDYRGRCTRPRWGRRKIGDGPARWTMALQWRGGRWRGRMLQANRRISVSPSGG